MNELPGFKAETMVLLVSLWAMRFGEAIWGSFALFSGGFLDRNPRIGLIPAGTTVPGRTGDTAEFHGECP